MNSLDIFLIKDINEIIINYKKEIDKIYELQHDIMNFRLYFERNVYDDVFKNIYVNISYSNFIIIIDKERFYNKISFNKFFHSLYETRRIKLFYLFCDIMLKKYSIIDFENEEHLFDCFNMNLFNFLFDDYENLSIKRNILYDFIYSYKLLYKTQKINIKTIIERLKVNSRIIVNHKRLPNTL